MFNCPFVSFLVFLSTKVVIRDFGIRLQCPLSLNGAQRTCDIRAFFELIEIYNTPPASERTPFTEITPRSSPKSPRTSTPSMKLEEGETNLSFRNEALQLLQFGIPLSQSTLRLNKTRTDVAFLLN